MYDEVEITYDVNESPRVRDVILDGRRMNCIYASVDQHPRDEYATLTLRMRVKKVHIKRFCVWRSKAGGI